MPDPNIYPKADDIIPYSPRGKFGFASETPYPNIYPKADDIIPYSPRGKFGFASPTPETTDKIIKLESMKDMSIDQIIDLYNNGYKIEDTSPTISTAQDGVYISTGAIIVGAILVGTVYYLFFKGKGSL